MLCMYIFLVLTSCTTIVTINIAFMRGYYVVANMNLLMLVTSIFRHSTNSLIENKVHKLQDCLSFVIDVSVVHFVGLCDVYFALNHMSQKTLCCTLVLLTIPYTYYRILNKNNRFYKHWSEFLIHGLFSHILGNIATSIMFL